MRRLARFIGVGRKRPRVGVLHFVGADGPGLPPVLEARIDAPHPNAPRAVYDVRLHTVWTCEGGFESPPWTPAIARAERRKDRLVRPRGCLCS